MNRTGSTSHVFTFAEVLAAMLLIAIVVPVALSAIQVANRASELGLRSEVATRLASSTLNQLVVTEDWQTSEATGVFEDNPAYSWELTAEDWPEDDDLGTSMTELTLKVTFALQGREQDVSVTTLVSGGEEE